MAITYPLSLPSTPGIRRIVIKGINVSALTASPFTLEQQVYLHQGERWAAEVTLPAMKRAAAEEWLAFLLSLRGFFGTFLLGDPAGKTPRGVATGSPQVDGASQTGTALNTKGWTASVTGILKAGDYLQIGSGVTTRLYKNLKDANSDALGKAAFDIWPRLRESPADLAVITLASAKGTFRLANNQADWDINEAQIYGLGFAALEAI